MPVDDATIEDLITKAGVKLESLSVERNDIKLFINTVANIRMVDTPDPADPNKTIKTKPQDRGLAAEMSDQRRQQIYDSVIAEALRLNI